MSTPSIPLGQLLIEHGLVDQAAIDRALADQRREGGLVSGLVSWRRYGARVAVFAVLNPAYWVLHSIAAWRAAYQMARTPHVWEKTPHGLDEEDGFAQPKAKAQRSWTPGEP